jgi:hypothetical protein
LGSLAIIAGVVVARLGDRVVPNLLAWLVAVMLVWAGLTVWTRSIGKRWPKFSWQAPVWPKVPKLRPVEGYDTPVKLAQVPNVPTAEMVCARLREAGIEAFYKAATPFGGQGSGISDLNPALPVEIWVGERQVERARHLLPDHPQTPRPSQDGRSRRK